jgi:hypothetical protein
VSERKSPLERAVDLFVYAPVGFALEARRLLPHLVEVGADALRGQLSNVRAVGEYAVQQGQKQASETLGTVGSLAGRTRRATSARPVRPASTPVSPSTSDGVGVSPAARPQTSADAQALAIPDYDSLSASQVVPRLAGLSHQELEAVRAYESAHRSRKTILNRVAQLQAG